MKKYLFGLGAMLVGAGLMFVLMHGEVSAKEGRIEMPDADCTEHYLSKLPSTTTNTNTTTLRYCKIKDLTCVLSYEGISCVRGSMF